MHNPEHDSPLDSGSPQPPTDAAERREADLMQRAGDGDEQALADLFSDYRPRLWRMISFRLHPRLQGRIDPDDVLQEAWIRAVDRMGHLLADSVTSSFLWFRTITIQALIDLHRRHLVAEKRAASRERSMSGGWSPGSTSMSLVHHLSGDLSTPSHAVLRAELSSQLDAALQGLSEIDREVLALRHFEELTNSETAQVLNMSEQAASGRYVRALGRLKHVLETIPDLADRATGRQRK